MRFEKSECQLLDAPKRRVSLQGAAVAVFTLFVSMAGTVDVFAQATTASLSNVVVTPGAGTVVTVTGTPGHYFAVVGSTTNAGFSYAGVQFAVGNDMRLLVLGQLDGNGRAEVYIVPPFVGTSLDRYYIQAATSDNPTNFMPLEVAPGQGDRQRRPGRPGGRWIDWRGGSCWSGRPGGSGGTCGPRWQRRRSGPDGPAGAGGCEWCRRRGGPDGSAGSGRREWPRRRDGCAGTGGC